MNNDQDIIKRCLKGKQEAYKLLYTKYKGYVYTICVRYGIQEYEIKDCMQVIFSEVFQVLDRYDAKKASFKTWMTRIAINQILNALRKKKIRFDLVADEDTVVFRDFGTNPASQMDSKFIIKVISMMPESYRMVFNLFVIEGFSHQEIASKLDISVGQSRVSLHRGREWAKQKLGHYFTDYKAKEQS